MKFFIPGSSFQGEGKNRPGKSNQCVIDEIKLYSQLASNHSLLHDPKSWNHPSNEVSRHGNCKTTILWYGKISSSSSTFCHVSSTYCCTQGPTQSTFSVEWEEDSSSESSAPDDASVYRSSVSRVISGVFVVVVPCLEVEENALSKRSME